MQKYTNYIREFFTGSIPTWVEFAALLVPVLGGICAGIRVIIKIVRLWRRYQHQGWSIKYKMEWKILLRMAAMLFVVYIAMALLFWFLTFSPFVQMWMAYSLNGLVLVLWDAAFYKELWNMKIPGETDAAETDNE